MTTQEWTKVLEEEVENEFNKLQINDYDELVLIVKHFILSSLYETEPTSISTDKAIAYCQLSRKYIIRK